MNSAVIIQVLISAYCTLSGPKILTLILPTLHRISSLTNFSPTRDHLPISPYYTIYNCSSLDRRSLPLITVGPWRVKVSLKTLCDVTWKFVHILFLKGYTALFINTIRTTVHVSEGKYQAPSTVQYLQSFLYFVTYSKSTTVFLKRNMSCSCWCSY